MSLKDQHKHLEHMPWHTWQTWNFTGSQRLSDFQKCFGTNPPQGSLPIPNAQLIVFSVWSINHNVVHIPPIYCTSICLSNRPSVAHPPQMSGKSQLDAHFSQVLSPHFRLETYCVVVVFIWGYSIYGTRSINSVIISSVLVKAKRFESKNDKMLGQNYWLMRQSAFQ